jgi:hypothetical protein
MLETAKVSLVTIIAGFELEERLVNDLRGLGVKGYTQGRVEGRGVHGPRLAGLVDAANMRLEMLVGNALARRIFDRIESKYGGQTIMAYRHEVEAIPRDEFV